MNLYRVSFWLPRYYHTPRVREDRDLLRFIHDSIRLTRSTHLVIVNKPFQTLYVFSRQSWGDLHDEINLLCLTYGRLTSQTFNLDSIQLIK